MIAGLASLPDEWDYIAVHDGARPLIDVVTIESAIGLLDHLSLRNVHLMGLVGMGALFLRAFSMGAGTFTGIEAAAMGLATKAVPAAH